MLITRRRRQCEVGRRFSSPVVLTRLAGPPSRVARGVAGRRVVPDDVAIAVAIAHPRRRSTGPPAAPGLSMVLVPVWMSPYMNQVHRLAGDILEQNVAVAVTVEIAGAGWR